MTGGARRHRPDERAAVRDGWIVGDGDRCRYRLFRRGDGFHPAPGGLAWFLHSFF